MDSCGLRICNVQADSVGLGLTMLKTMFTGFNMEVKSISFVAGLLSPYYIFVIIMAIILHIR